MLLKIIHETNLVYTALISGTVMELRMAPRQEQDQHRLSFNLAIGPATQVTSYFDWLGNTVLAFTINPLHDRIRIVATSVVETDRPSRDATHFDDQWPIRLPDDYALYDYLQFGGAVADGPELREMTRSLNPRPGMSAGSLALRMLALIDEKFQYETGVTTAASPITEVLAHRRGVCQDFAHLMIGMSRAMGIPARYISGILHPDRERYRGCAQTHAWCELFLPSMGWVGFDPTNNCAVGQSFVKIATGRDYRDVPPHKGLFKGQALESMTVSVTSEELTAMPMGMPAERMQSLPVASYGTRRDAAREAAASRLIQQQQQQRKEADGEYHQQQQQQQ